MRWYSSDEPVPPGTYLSPRVWELRRVGGQRKLEGGGPERYLRIPGYLLPLVLVLGAVSGLLYVLVLPLYGFALMVQYAGAGLAHALQHLGRRPGVGRQGSRPTH